MFQLLHSDRPLTGTVIIVSPNGDWLLLEDNDTGIIVFCHVTRYASLCNVQESAFPLLARPYGRSYSFPKVGDTLRYVLGQPTILGARANGWVPQNDYALVVRAQLDYMEEPELS